MFEGKNDELLPMRQFLFRLARSFGGTLLLIAASLLIGAIGYHHFGRDEKTNGHISWVDAVHNASMILTGMGPVDKMPSDGGKLFATFYALYSGIAFLTMIAILGAPLLHRLLHKFHLDQDDESDDDKKSKKTRGNNADTHE